MQLSTLWQPLSYIILSCKWHSFPDIWIISFALQAKQKKQEKAAIASSNEKKEETEETKKDR